MGGGIANTFPGAPAQIGKITGRADLVAEAKIIDKMAARVAPVCQLPTDVVCAKNSRRLPCATTNGRRRDRTTT